MTQKLYSRSLSPQITVFSSNASLQQEKSTKKINWKCIQL